MHQETASSEAAADPSATLQFVRVDAGRLPTLLDLLATLDAEGKPPLELAYAQAVLARLDRYPDYAVWLAYENGEVVGTYALMLMDNLGHRGRPAGIVENVAVIPQARGRGIGRAMMQHAMDHCAKAGAYKLVLSSNLRREDAHRFYNRLDFERHGYSFRIAITPSAERAPA